MGRHSKPEDSEQEQLERGDLTADQLAQRGEQHRADQEALRAAGEQELGTNPDQR
jgi:hypothetical protein